ncbi:MAG: FAD-dependent oxidoreductase, partial [Alphaproteobacteria bacterium]
LLMAEDFFAAATAASGLPTGYARTGRLQPLPDAAAIALAQTRATNAQTLWGAQALWQIIPATDAWHPNSPTGRLVHDTLTARLHPRLTARALGEAIRAKGGQIIVGDAPDHGPTIHATGVAGLETLSRVLGRRVGDGVKGQAILLAYDARDQPQLFVDTLHIVPHHDGTTAIGSTSEHGYTDATNTDAALDALLQKAFAALPLLRTAAILERWAGVRPRASSRAPLLGPWPERPDHYVANGGFKIGFGMAPKVARTMVDLVLNQTDTIPAPFRLTP